MRSPNEICPVCNCQRPLGAFYPIFDRIYELRKTALLSKEGMLPGNFTSLEDRSIDMGDVLDMLKITSMCCRSKMLSHYP